MNYVLYKELDIFPQENGKVTVYHRKTRKTYSLGAKEAQVLQCFDGVNTLEAVQIACPFYSEEEIAKLTQAFCDLGFFEGHQKKRYFNPLKIHLRLLNPNNIIACDSTAASILSRSILYGCPVVFLLGLVTLLLNRLGVIVPQFSAEAVVSGYMQMDATDILLLFLINFLCLSAHELAHAITARRCGVNVPEIGIMLYCLVPCAYTNISGIRLLKSDRRKIAVLLSGSCMNLGIAGACMIAFWFTANLTVGVFLIAAIVMNLGTVFLNGVCFLKFDGYYILEVLLNEPAFHEKAMLHLKQCLMLAGEKYRTELAAFHKSLRQSEQAAVQHLFYCTYAILSVVFVPVLIGNVIFSYLV